VYVYRRVAYVSEVSWLSFELVLRQTLTGKFTFNLTFKMQKFQLIYMLGFAPLDFTWLPLVLRQSFVWPSRCTCPDPHGSPADTRATVRA